MIEPAVQNCPSDNLAPNLLDLESRPFFVDPTPFLEANNCKSNLNIMVSYLHLLNFHVF